MCLMSQKNIFKIENFFKRYLKVPKGTFSTED